MTIQASNTIAGVAQTAHTAQQVARSQERQKGNPADEAKQVREKFETHLRSFEDDTAEDSPTHLHVDGELPQQGRGGQQGKKPDQQNPPEVESAIDTSTDATDDKSGKLDDPSKNPLYRHLDVRA